MADKPTVREWIAQLPEPERGVVERVAACLSAAAPEATARVKWGQPVWESNGPLAYVKPFSRTVNVGFWRGTQLDDPDRLLSGEGELMRHLKLAPGDPIPEAAIGDWVRQAVILNDRLGSPVRRR
jgi:hypothetical protein